MTKAPIIGIIGGAGVAAGAELVRRLEEIVTTNGAFRDAHHPEVLLYQATQVPSRSLFLEGRGESFVPGYIEAALKLKQAGASFIAMCCNTAHARLDEIRRAVDMPFIDMPEVTLRMAQNATPNATIIGIMCSDGTRAAQVYEKTANRLELHPTLIQPDAEHQAKITTGICNIKKGYHRSKPIDDPERPRRLYREAFSHLVERGAQVIILGCTEIPLDFVPSDPLLPTVDCISILAQACLDKHREIISGQSLR